MPDENPQLVQEVVVKPALAKIIGIPVIIVLVLIAAVFISYKLTSNDKDGQISIINHDNKMTETVQAIKKNPTEVKVSTPKKFGR